MERKYARCDECGSKYLKSSSKMASLCPECSHVIYGYENCEHVFKNGRCIRCRWDGSRSEYINYLLSDESAPINYYRADRLKKVIIIGCSGSGKSTFARKLSDLIGLPLYYLDMIWHKPDRTTLTEAEFDSRLKEILEKDRWIIDGNYQRTLETRLKECDTVFFFNIPTELCLEGAMSRIGKQRVDLPWLETEFDDEFRQWICDYPKNSLPKVTELLKKYKKEKQIVVFDSREESDEYLAWLCS